MNCILTLENKLGRIPVHYNILSLNNFVTIFIQSNKMFKRHLRKKKKIQIIISTKKKKFQKMKKIKYLLP